MRAAILTGFELPAVPDHLNAFLVFVVRRADVQPFVDL